MSVTDRIEQLKRRAAAYRDAIRCGDGMAGDQVWTQLQHHAAARHPIRPRKQATTMAPQTNNDGGTERFAEQLRSATACTRSSLQADDDGAGGSTAMEFRHRATATSDVAILRASAALRDEWSPTDLGRLSGLLVASPAVADILQDWGRLRDLQQCCSGRDALLLVRQQRLSLDHDDADRGVFDVVVVSLSLPDLDLTASALVQQLRAVPYRGAVIVVDDIGADVAAKPFHDTDAVVVRQSQLS